MKRLLRRTGRSAPPRTLVAASLAVAVGVVTGHLLDPDALTGASWYPALAGVLLAVGLYGSTHEIDLREVRRDLRALALTVTVGVLLKAALIAGVMVAAFREPQYLVLGIAVAQIDPLSVAAMSRGDRMSPRARNLLSVWASFDDPMTVLLTLYFSVLAFRLSGRSGTPGTGPTGDGLAAYALSLGGNLLLFTAVAGLGYLVRTLSRRAAARARRTTATDDRTPPARVPSPRLGDALCLLLVVAAVAVAAPFMLMLAVAALGLVVRTGRYAPLVNRSVTVAFVLAALLLGLLLADGVSPWRGLVLGLAAFGAQALIGLLVAPLVFPDLAPGDRVHLGLGQQNGITAVILALALEPDFPGTVAIVGPAVLTVNTLHYAANGLWNAHRARVAADPGDPPPAHERPGPSDDDEPPPHHPGATGPGDAPGAPGTVPHAATGTDAVPPPAPVRPATDSARP
ncbi:hypothetical protein JNUCC64_28830 [Streptomyces sp. JNUCC 64]